jgi:hypothetical protein
MTTPGRVEESVEVTVCFLSCCWRLERLLEGKERLLEGKERLLEGKERLLEAAEGQEGGHEVEE